MSRLSAWITGPAGVPAQIAHRLTQPRRRRKVVPLPLHTVATLADLLDSRRPSIAWLHPPKALAANQEMLFPELANDEIRGNHFAVQSCASGIGLALVRNVLVSGPSLVGRSWLLYRLGPLAPLYVDDYLSNGVNIGDRKITRKVRRRVTGVCVLVTHWNANVYGHWLLECMPKLLLLRRYAAELPPFRILLPRSMRGWLTSWIRHILPGATLESYDDDAEYLDCETILMPTLLTDPEHHFFHPDLAELLQELLPQNVRHESRRRKLYVSRSEPSFYRELTNQSEIEAIAMEEGLEIVAPETSSIDEQIALFAGADLIVGEFGSAMHNTLFSPAGASVFCLNWINGLQSRIGQLKQHRVGYLLPSDGVPVKYVDGAPRQRYHIDPARFRDCVRTLVARTR